VYFFPGGNDRPEKVSMVGYKMLFKWAGFRFKSPVEPITPGKGISLYYIPQLLPLIESPPSTAIPGITPPPFLKTRANWIPQLFCLDSGFVLRGT
jgi:hypothetical protein